VEIFLAPETSEVLARFPGLGEYFHLAVNTLGTQADGIGFHALWDGKWNAAAAQSDARWSVEIRVPFSELGTHPKDGDFWQANFCRHEPRLKEFSTWSPMDEGFHEQRHFGRIGFVRSTSLANLLEKDAVERAGEEIRQRYLSEAARGLKQVGVALEDVSGKEKQAGAGLVSDFEALIREIGRMIRGLEKESVEVLIQKQEILREENATLQQRCAHVCNRAWVVGLPKGGPAGANGVYAVFCVKAVTDRRILPYTNVRSQPAADLLSVAACRGEYEPLSFVVVGREDISGLEVVISELKNGKHVLPAESIDAKVVKCWHQSAARKLWEVAYLKPKGKVLVPELLLNDESLVAVDLEKETTAVRVLDPETQETSYVDITAPSKDFERVHFGQIKDATTLQPVNIPAGLCRQFWLTVHVPEDAVAGTYGGRVTLKARNAPDMHLPMEVTVYPFDLADSVLENAVYVVSNMGREYMLKTGYINRRKGNPFNHYWSKYHTRLGLENMRAHGIDAPMFHQKPFGERSMTTEHMRSLFDDYMLLLKETGYPLDRFFYFTNWADVTYPGLKCPFGNLWHANREEAEKRFKWVPGVRPRTAVYLNYADVIGEVLLDIQAKTEKHGFREFWYYFTDETGPPELPVIYPYLHEYKKTGLKTYLTTAKVYFIDEEGRINREFWEETVGAVDGITFPRKLNPTLAALAKEAGVRVYSYNNPQLGVEYPHTYRRNYGLALWCAGYSGGMDFCYTDSDWNDFSNEVYRDHNMVYPSADRMIDTLQWEGYREGVDDQRYLSTLLKAVETAKKGGWLARRRARKAEKWVESIEVEDTLGWDGFEEGVDDVDLDDLRRRMAAWIMRLSG